MTAQAPTLAHPNSLLHSSRLWIALAIVAVVVAAIVIALVLAASGSSSGSAAAGESATHLCRIGAPC